MSGSGIPGPSKGWRCCRCYHEAGRSCEESHFFLFEVSLYGLKWLIEKMRMLSDSDGRNNEVEVKSATRVSIADSKIEPLFR